MASVCYLIVCVHLLYLFETIRPETVPTSRILNKEEKQQEKFINSVNAENQYELLAQTVTPYYKLPYDEQLEKKKNHCRAMIENIVNISNNLNNLMSYKILNVIPSPLTRAYRNNDEFQIRHGVDGNPKTVGCVLGKAALGKTLAVHPTHIITIKESHKRVAQVYEDFIRTSPLPANVQAFDGGHWNTLIVRSNDADEIIASVTVQPKGFSYQEILNQKKKLHQYFYNILPNITLYHQVCRKSRCTHDDSPFLQLYGKNQYICEILNSYKFKIYPGTIFPINKAGTEAFYETLIRTAKVQPNTTVLDICSGKGTNSIILSKYVNQVFGFETFTPAVDEANRVANYNDIQNVDFQWGKVDNKLNAVLRTLNESSDVVAILNHRRSGLGLDIITTIRRCLKINRLVSVFYKSNTPNNIRNFIELCSNNYLKVPPFRLTKVIPVDLLPHTPFVELILLFERKPLKNISNEVSM